MSGKSYMLVNPYIEGTTKKIFKADNSLMAAQEAYESISKYFNNEVKNYHFTLLKIKSDAIDKNDLTTLNLETYKSDMSNKYFNKNNFSHFNVNEKMHKDGNVSYNISKLDKTIDNLDTLIDNVIKIQNKYGNFNNSSSENSSEMNGGSHNSNSSSTGSYTGSSNSESSSQSGGSKSSKYTDDDDDDSSDYYRRRNRYDPINYWYYAPYLYDVDSMYMPTFISPLTFPYFNDLYMSRMVANYHKNSNNKSIIVSTP